MGGNVIPRSFPAKLHCCDIVTVQHKPLQVGQSDAHGLPGKV